MHCPQSPLPPDTPANAYPSPRSKSPPSSRLVPKLPTITRYPFVDITNFSLAQAASELAPSTPRLGGQDGGNDTILRSPIPLFSDFSSRSPIFEPVPAPFPATPRPHKWTARRARTLAPRSPPPSPRRTSKYLKCSPPSPSRSPERQHPVAFPSVADPPLRAAHFLPLHPAGQPSFTTSPRIIILPPQNSTGKKRTRRDFAELQWQITVHRSLAWRVRAQREKPRTEEKMNFNRGGLMIAFAEVDDGHWTDALETRLVALLWEKLMGLGCRSVSRVYSHGSVSSPTTPGPREGVPFPTLAPPIQLESLINNDTVPRRARVSALSFASPASNFPPGPPPPPKGILSPTQLVAQMMLRRSQAHAKPIRRAPGGVLRRGKLGQSGLEQAVL